MGRLEGVRAVVTGAGSGIGLAVVRRYLAEGAKVVGVVQRQEELAIVEAAGAAGVQGDVRDFETSEGAVAEAVGRFGGLDVFVANAGIWDFHRRLELQSPQDLRAGFEEILGVNVLGALFGARAAVAELRRSQGAVIATGSNASFLAGGGGALYTASKFALRGVVMQLAREFAPDVRVNGVAPGATDTGLSGAATLGQDGRQMNADPDRIAAMARHMPLGRVATPDDHTGLFVLLASRQDSAYVTGAMLLSDGGLTISV